MHDDDMNWTIECAAFAVMLSLSVIVGLYYGCVEGKQNTIGEYLLGGKHMTVFPVTMSLIASHVSGTMLLGVPSEVYSYGTQLLVLGITNAFVIIIVVHVYLPVFYGLQLTSVYEYLELRFGPSIRGLMSIIFALSLILSIPVVIYMPALAFNQVTGINVHLVTPFICVICIFYTTIGGLKAVVWTDAIQSVFTVSSVIFVIVLGQVQVGGIRNVIRANLESGRIEMFKMDPDPFLRNSFWTVGIGMLFSWINHLGIHPGTVQRCVALPTYKKARDSLIYFGLGMSVILILSGSIGMIVYTKYKDCDPITAQFIGSDRNLLPYYIVDVASKFPGLTGLFISGLVSAALSTMSAQLNTVAGTIYEDIVVKIVTTSVSESTASIIMKCIVVFVGAICVGLVIIVEKLKGIVQLSLSLSSVTSGSILSVFTLGVCFPRANNRGAVCGMLASLGIMTWIITGAQLAIHNNELKFTEKNVSIAGCPTDISFKNRTDFSGLYRVNEDVYASPNVWTIYTISYMHYSTIGTLVGVAVGMVISLLFPTGRSVDPKLLAPFVRKLTCPEYKTKNNNFRDGTQTEGYKLVIQDAI